MATPSSGGESKRPVPHRRRAERLTFDKRWAAKRAQKLMLTVSDKPDIRIRLIKGLPKQAHIIVGKKAFANEKQKLIGYKRATHNKLGKMFFGTKPLKLNDIIDASRGKDHSLTTKTLNPLEQKHVVRGRLSQIFRRSGTRSGHGHGGLKG